MRIAVLICSLVFDSQKAFMKGIERRVRDWCDVCSVFCCHVNIVQEDSHGKGEYSIFGLPDFSYFDGVIFVRNTFQNPREEEILINRIKKAGVPCVSVDAVSDDFVNIISDESGISKALTEHLIVEHGCKKLYFLGGQSASNDTSLRFEGFKAALEEHNLEFKSEWRMNGTFEFTSGVLAADYFIHVDETLPDAIVCSNDEMAIGLITELKKRGIKIPRDVRVTGIDFDSVSRVFSPRLTTAKRQQYQKGVSAVNIIHEYESHPAGEVITLPIVLSIGESCGCKLHDLEKLDITTTNSLSIDRYSSEEITQTVKRMSAALMAKHSHQELLDELKEYGCALNADELYLCMNIRPEITIDYADYSKALDIIDRDNSEDYSSSVTNVVTVINGDIPNDWQNETFNKSDLFPPVANGGRMGGTYYFLPIHYINRNFGYAILGTSGELVRNEFFPNWCTIASNALENARKRAVMEQMISALDRMWIYDTLTGIYNRAGFFKLSEGLVRDSILASKPVAVVFMDVDGLKEVNDKYGHDMGDSLIKDMANILRKLKRHNEIIMRYGGDEFVLLASGYSDDDAKECINRIEASIASLNEEGIRPYTLDASIGYCLTVLKDLEELNHLIDNADREMYKNKNSKKAKKANKQLNRL